MKKFLSELIGLSLMFFVGLHMDARAASFDCDNPRSRVEKLICTDSELSKIESTLALAHKKSSKYNTALRQGQDKKFQLDMNKCADTNCLRRVLKREMALFQTEMESSNDLKPSYDYCQNVFNRLGLNPKGCGELTPDLDNGICDAYLSNLNKLQKIPVCDIPHLSDSESIEWHQIPVLDNLEVAYNIDYYVTRTTEHNWHNFTEWKSAFIQDVQKKKIEPRMRRTKLRMPNGDDVDVIGYTRDADACRKRSSGKFYASDIDWTESGYSHATLVDNKESPTRDLFNAWIGDFVIFKGVAFYVMQTNGASFSITRQPSRQMGARDSAMKQVCRISIDKR